MTGVASWGPSLIPDGSLDVLPFDILGNNLQHGRDFSPAEFCF